MNVNVNLTPKNRKIKKILILLLFSLLCFFIKENVFAADLDGNNTTEQMPPFLKEFYTVSTSEATCDDNVSGYCNLYSHLEQFFSEFHSTYKKVLVFGSAIEPTGQSYYSIFFFMDTPYINKTDYSNLGKENDIHIYNEAGNALKYYKITFKYSGLIDENITNIDNNKVIKNSILISYHYESENFTYVSLGYDERAICKGILSNFDLYSTNKQIYHSSDVKNWTYVNLKSKTGLMLIPKNNTEFSSYFSYNNSDTYVSWYDINNKTTDGYKLLDKPVSDTLSYYITYTSDRLNKYNFIIYNKANNSTKVGYIAEDFDIVVFTDLYSSAVGTDGKTYDNPLADLDKDINNDIVFSSDKSILENIVSFFTHFGDFLNNLLTGILNGFKNLFNSLFIPDKEIFEDFINQEYEFLKEKLGFLLYPIDLIIDFSNRFYNISNSQNAVFTIPKIKFMNVVLFEENSIDLLSIVNSNDTIKNLYSIYRVFVSGLIVIWLCCLAKNKYDEIFGGGK